MPTASPIMAASCGANSATLKTFAVRSTTCCPTASEITADSTGRMAPMSEPNASSRMNSATRMPMPSLLGGA